MDIKWTYFNHAITEFQAWKILPWLHRLVLRVVYASLVARPQIFATVLSRQHDLFVASRPRRLAARVALGVPFACIVALLLDIAARVPCLRRRNKAGFLRVFALRVARLIRLDAFAAIAAPLLCLTTAKI